ncbi:MAG TPA: zinc ribbon domain-containing protein [Pyrinomonadaceae bacterium]|nr:zinc ribbon domain-containing protein [Pyrinomonadaceae bacterium]
MQTCQKCGAEVKAEQAFCSKCGAVVGMGDAAARKGGDEWDMASTFVTKKPGTAPLHRPGATGERARPVTADRAAPTPAPAPGPAPTPADAATKPAGGGNKMLYALIGFVAVLIAGVLLILLFYMNSKG